MVELILHIGDGKCGSSSIQASLFHGRDSLLEQKVLYLSHSGEGGHSHYTALLNRKTHGDENENRNISKYNIKNINISLHNRNTEYLILSSEYFMSMNADSVLSFLVSVFETDITAVHIIAYVRCPAGRYLSGMQQRIKSYHKLNPPDKFRWNLAGRLLRWSTIITNGSVSVGLFDRNLLKQGSVVHDFGGIVSSITGKHGICLPDTAENTSLSAEQSIVLQDFRADFLSHMDGKFARESNRLIQFFTSINRQVGLLATKSTLLESVRDLVNFHNMPFVRKLDRQFSWLNMEERCTGDVVSSIDTLTPWPSERFESILETYDGNVVRHLRDLLPHYNSDLRERLNRKAENALGYIGDSRKFLELYCEYLASEECHDTAAQVKALIAADA